MEEESTSSLSTRNGEKKEQKRGVEQITLMNESIVYSFTSLSVSDLGPYQKHISRSHPPDRQRNHSGLGTTTLHALPCVLYFTLVAASRDPHALPLAVSHAAAVTGRLIRTKRFTGSDRFNLISNAKRQFYPSTSISFGRYHLQTEWYLETLWSMEKPNGEEEEEEDRSRRKGLATTARVPSKVRRTVFTEASSNRTNGAPIDQAQARPEDKPVLDVAEARSYKRHPRLAMLGATAPWFIARKVLSRSTRGQSRLQLSIVVKGKDMAPRLLITKTGLDGSREGPRQRTSAAGSPGVLAEVQVLSGNATIYQLIRSWVKFLRENELLIGATRL
uniref:Uncharacterized protein n=2 Tax=Oryza TaxID=4527 RepID=A0A0D3ETU8_9ORYZ